LEGSKARSPLQNPKENEEIPELGVTRFHHPKTATRRISRRLPLLCCEDLTPQSIPRATMFKVNVGISIPFTHGLNKFQTGEGVKSWV